MSNPPSVPSATPPAVARAQALLRSCVHCGFCNATCPTYALTGDEREGPRGRLHLMEAVFAGHADLDVAPLDHCLTCRSCESTCPAGVRYGDILAIAREHAHTSRGALARALDTLLETSVGARGPIQALARTAQRVRPLLPRGLKRRVRPRERALVWPTARHATRVGLLLGCVQPALAPDIDLKAAIVLDHLGISAVALASGCCGALPYHLHASAKGRAQARATLARDDAAYAGLTTTATGCTAFLRDYPHLFADSEEARAAERFSARVQDIGAWIDPLLLTPVAPRMRRRLAWHAPCSLQHGLRDANRIAAVLEALGHTLVPVDEPSLCCGSAGAYSLRYPRWGRRLGERKWRALTLSAPQEVVTANIGCLQHLAARADRPVRHWIELVYEALTNPGRDARD